MPSLAWLDLAATTDNLHELAAIIPKEKGRKRERKREREKMRAQYNQVTQSN